MIECQAIESPYLTYYAYAIGILAAIWIAVIAIKQRKSMNREQRKILILLTIGSEFSLLLFNLSNIVGSWTLDWHISQYGLFGIPVFIGLLSYLIIKYRVFDVKLVAAQALVIALIILGVTQIIFVKDKSNLSLRSIAIGLFITLCVWLIYSIRTETRQKDELSQANQKLKRLDQAKDDFINIASHQLKSPIAILKNTLEVSNQDQVSKNESSKQISRLETLVSEILLASKLATEKYSAKNQDVINLQKLIQEIVDDQKALSQEKVDLVFRFPSQATPELRGDQLYLREAFANVIHNAVKYSKPDTKNTIELLLQYGSQDNPQEKTYTFTCKDSGIGISKEDLSKLFTKFSRGSNVYAKSGTGLGLYITKEIIEGHGGHIAIMSELGKGTEVTIALLAGKAEAN
jgi:signal transduction histidine kinase